MVPKIASGRKYNVHRRGDTPRTFWNLLSKRFQKEFTRKSCIK